MIRWRIMAPLVGVACSLGMFAAGARAGSLEMLITESAGPTIPIADNGGLDMDPTIGVINVNTALLNLRLVNYQFAALGTRSTSPGAGGTEFLTQNGLAQLLVGGTGSIAIIASDVDFNQPAPGPGTLHTSATAVFINATDGNTNTFRGWFNPDDALGGMGPPRLPNCSTPRRASPLPTPTPPGRRAPRTRPSRW